jgi:hypothetical protein
VKAGWGVLELINNAILFGELGLQIPDNDIAIVEKYMIHLGKKKWPRLPLNFRAEDVRPFGVRPSA